MNKFVGTAVGFPGGGFASLITVGLIVSVFEMKYQPEKHKRVKSPKSKFELWRRDP